MNTMCVLKPVVVCAQRCIDLVVDSSIVLSDNFNNNKKLHRLTQRDSRLADFCARNFRLLPVQDLTSYSCSMAMISHKDDKILRLTRLIFEI